MPSERLRTVVAVLVLFMAAVCPMSAQENGQKADALVVFGLAQDLHEKGDLPGAVKLYGQAIEILPEFPEAEFQRAAALSSLGRKDEAIKGYLRAAELRPQWALPYSTAGRLLLTKGNVDEAQRVLEKALELEPADGLALAAMADLRIRTKASVSVLSALLTKIADLTAKASPAPVLWTAKAALERELGRNDAAKVSLERALAVDPSDLTAIILLANSAVEDGDLTRARDLASRLEKVAPASSDLHYLRANIFLRSGDQAAALKEIDAMPASDANAIALRAHVVASTAATSADLEKQLAVSPNSGELLGRLCEMNRRTDPAKALGYCKRASELEPKNVQHAIGYAAALVQAKQYEPAVSLLRKLIVFAPANWTAHANLATALFQLNRFTEAKEEYDWLAQKQPSAAAPHLFLGIVHDRLGEFRDAMLEYQAYLKLADPVENKGDIEKINLRLPGLQRDIKKGKKK